VRQVATRTVYVSILPVYVSILPVYVSILLPRNRLDRSPNWSITKPSQPWCPGVASVVGVRVADEAGQPPKWMPPAGYAYYYFMPPCGPTHPRDGVEHG
jgi:hypothetical protein